MKNMSDEMCDALHQSVFSPNPLFFHMKRRALLEDTDNPEVAALWEEIKMLQRVAIPRYRTRRERFMAWIRGQ